MPIRLAHDDDAAAIAAIYAPYVASSTATFEVRAPSAVDMRQRLQEVAQQYPWLVFVDDDEQVCGYAYACAHRARAAYQWTAESSVYIAEDAHRRGIAKALYEALFRCLQHLGVHRVLAGITAGNDGSTRFHQSFGFTRVGTYVDVGFKFDAWHDVTWWQLPLLSGPPLQPPRPAAQHQDELASLLHA